MKEDSPDNNIMPHGRKISTLDLSMLLDLISEILAIEYGSHIKAKDIDNNKRSH